MALKMIILLLLVDFTLYWVHRLMHLRRFMPMHIWHHSPSAINWFSGFRGSFLHLSIYSVVQILWARYLFPLSVLESSIGLSFGVFFQYFQHANINFPFSRIEWVLVTPRSHRLHHTRGQYMNSNFAHMFTLWDRLFGTYTSPEKVSAKTMKVGLASQIYRKKFGVFRSIIGV